MGERLEELESRVADLAARLGALEARLAETAPAVAPEPGEPAAVAEPRRPPTLEPLSFGDLAGLPALVGRTAVVLGLAFLLRALVEDGTLSPTVGVGVGYCLAVALYALADRALAGGARRSAAFHGGTAAIVGVPLVWEAATSLGVLSTWGGAACLLALTLLGAAVAARRDEALQAWIATGLATPACLGLVLATHAAVAYTVALVVIAAGVYLLAAKVPSVTWLGVTPAAARRPTRGRQIDWKAGLSW